MRFGPALRRHSALRRLYMVAVVVGFSRPVVRLPWPSLSLSKKKSLVLVFSPSFFGGLNGSCSVCLDLGFVRVFRT